MKFPLYRKYFNELSFFKIISEKEFEEKQKIGSLVHKHHVIASQFPEMLRIKDMAACKDGIWKEMSKTEYDLL